MQSLTRKKEPDVNAKGASGRFGSVLGSKEAYTTYDAIEIIYGAS